MLYYWTKECEQGIADIRYDRRALQSTLRKYGVTMSKLCMVLAKGGWKAMDDNNVMIQRIRLESMISVSYPILNLSWNLGKSAISLPTTIILVTSLCMIYS